MHKRFNEVRGRPLYHKMSELSWLCGSRMASAAPLQLLCCL